MQTHTTTRTFQTLTIRTSALRKRAFLTALALLALTPQPGCKSESTPQPTATPEPWILCNRFPTAYVVGEDFKGYKDPCMGSAKIQAIAYKCGTVTEVEQRTKEFFDANTEKAREQCEELCKSRGKNCIASFKPQKECGFSVPKDKALFTGQNLVVCPSHCEGQAFSYCSIYHASYLRVDPELFREKESNCYCKSRQ